MPSVPVEYRVEIFEHEWRRETRVRSAEGLQNLLNDLGRDGWSLKAWETRRDETPPDNGGGNVPPRPAEVVVAIFQRPAG